MNKSTIGHSIIRTANICIFILIFLIPKINSANNYLPKPKGSYAVGTTDFFFTDSTRFDHSGITKKYKRKL